MAVSAFVKVYAAVVPVPVMTFPLPASNQLGVVAFQAPAPPVPATVPFTSQKILAARAFGGAETLRRAAATIRDARERILRDFRRVGIKGIGWGDRGGTTSYHRRFPCRHFNTNKGFYLVLTGVKLFTAARAEPREMGVKNIRPNPFPFMDLCCALKFSYVRCSLSGRSRAVPSRAGKAWPGRGDFW